MNDLILSQMRQRLEILYQMVDELERGGGGGGGSDDSYTKAQTDTLLSYKADKSTTYTKSQTDNLLSAKANKSTTYTKTEVDTALAEKANASTTYTKTEVNTALAAKADKTNTYTKTQTDNLLNLKANTSYVNTVKDTADTANTLAVDNRAALINIVDEGAKNLLKITASSQTIKGVTFTVNDDQTVTVNGTNSGTGSATFVIVPSAQASTIPDGKYILSGCPAGGGSSSYDLRWYLYSPGKSAFDVGAGFLVEKSGNTTNSNIAIVVKEGQTVNNLVFKPMLCAKAAWDISQEYQPYRPTYQELVEMVEALQPTS